MNKSRNTREGKFQGSLSGKAVRGQWPIDGYALPVKNRKQAKALKRLLKSIEF